jgi:hypothetical protein
LTANHAEDDLLTCFREVVDRQREGLGDPLREIIREVFPPAQHPRKVGCVEAESTTEFAETDASLRQDSWEFLSKGGLATRRQAV